jgi:exonuclease SbcC
MKFKKVEIQAFRAYNLAEEGTFDFERADGTADFVAIYAPNGFGKTSFYDAVEWGVTHNIHRFLRRHKFNQQVAKTEKNLNKTNQTSILRNKFAEKDLPAFVKLYTTASEQPIINILSKARKGQPDYKFDEQETIRGYFQEVILSQEWIDSFLKEENGNDRYKTFIKYFGDRELDKYYKSIILLLKTNEDHIKALRASLKNMAVDLAFKGDKLVLNRVNKVISYLNKKEENIPLLNQDFNDQKSILLNGFITQRQHELEKHSQNSKKIIDLLEELISGSGKAGSLEDYFKNLTEGKSLEAKIAERQTQIELFEKIEAFLTEEKNKRAEITKLLEGADYFRKLIAALTGFQKVSKEIENLNLERTGIDSDLLKRGDTKIILDDDIQKLEFDLFKQSSSITNLDWTLKRLPNLSSDIESNEKKRSLVVRKLRTLDSKNVELARNIEQLQGSIHEIQGLISKLFQKDEIIPVLPAVEKFRANIELLNEQRLRITELTAEGLQISTNLENRQVLNNDLQDFLRRGLDMVNRTGNSSCPLCQHDYQSYIELADRISNNQSLNIAVKELFNEQSLNVSQQQQYTIMEVSSSGQLNNSFLNESSLLQNELSKAFLEQSQVRTELQGCEAELPIIDARLTELNMELKNLSFKDYQSSLQERLRIEKAEKNRLSRLLELKEKDLKKHNDEVDALRLRIKQIGNEIQGLNINPDYKLIMTYLKVRNSGSTQTLTVKQLNDLLKTQDVAIKKAESELSELLLAYKTLTDSMSALNKEKLSEELKSLTATLRSLRTAILSFEQVLKGQFGISTEGKKQKEIAATFDKITKQHAKIMEANLDLISQYELLGKIKDEVIPFLKFQQAKQTEKETKDRIVFLENSMKSKLEGERDLVTEHINNQVSAFFYEKVINNIYKKIDPHPDYTSIEFICDFVDDKPQLNVCVSDGKKNNLQIPNLYFSTAQLNVLSLSIFLAKALHAVDDEGKPLECIFIDDPIQSMDSINILSTIDLLRSIIVNHERQIILSTHDSNFHNLLMKKIPQDIFNSKYMELETFGKVKQEKGFD